MQRDIKEIILARMPDFSKAHQRIGQYILDHYDKAAYMTAAKLGDIVHVSESTVVRFAIQMGYEGYPEFQKALQEYIRTRLTSFQRVEVTNNLIGDGDVLEKVLTSDAERIRKTLDNIDRKAFNEAVDKIIRAEKIYIMGVRSSSSLAGFLYFNFRIIFDSVRLVQTTSGSELFEQILNIGPKDTMIAISFPRYSKRIINAVEFAHNAGANVVSITDRPKSPIATFGDQVLIAQSDVVSFVESLVAPLSLINALVVAVSLKKHDELTDRLHKLELIWDEYDVYDKTHG